MSAAAVHPFNLSWTHTKAFRQRYWIPAIQVLTDLLALEAALALGVAIRLSLSHRYPITLSFLHIRGIAVGLLVIPIGCLLVGLYPGYGLAPAERLRRRVRANFFVFSGLIAWGYLVHRDWWSRGVLIATMLIALLTAPLVERFLIQFLSRVDRWGAAAVIFGTNQSGHAVADLMRAQPGVGFVPVAVLDIEHGESWSGAALAEIAQRHLLSAGLEAPRVAVVAMPALEESRRQALLEALPYRCIIVMSDIVQIQTQCVTAVEIGGALGLALNRNLLVPWNRWLKRAFDVVAATLLLVLSIPLLAVCAAWIRLSSRGSAFYSQERAGAGSRTIRVWKLRTMHPDADRLLAQVLERDPGLRAEWETRFKLRRDPRVLPGVGHFLRRTSLDELPQLWNVVTGAMSLVGPRPFPRYHLDHFDPDFLRLRKCVRPGLTGLWQVSARSEGDLNAQQALDTYYIRNWSVWLDIEIAIRTVRAVVRGSGAY